MNLETKEEANVIHAILSMSDGIDHLKPYIMAQIKLRDEEIAKLTRERNEWKWMYDSIGKNPFDKMTR